MRMVFGVVGLLLVLAIVGMLAKRSWQASVVGVPPAAASASAGATGVDARTLPRQVADDVNRLMQQAPARGDGDPP